MAKKKASKKKAKSSVNIKIEDVGSLVEKAKCCSPKETKSGCGGFSYFLGFLGASVYYITTAPGFWAGVWGVIKAIFWPAFVVYGLMKYIGM